MFCNAYNLKITTSCIKIFKRLTTKTLPLYIFTPNSVEIRQPKGIRFDIFIQKYLVILGLTNICDVFFFF